MQGRRHTPSFCSVVALAVTQSLWAVALASVLCVSMLAGCAPDASGPLQGSASVSPVAAHLDEGDITEDEVSSYIARYRSDMGVEDDQAWKALLDDHGFTAESFREMTIYELAAKMVIAQKAQESGVVVGDEVVQEALEGQKEALGVGDGPWQEMLDSYGVDEASYAENLRYQILRSAVFGHYVPVPEASDEQVASYLASTYGGKTAHLVQLISNAQPNVLESVLSDLMREGVYDSQSFSDYVREYSDGLVTDDESGIWGWDLQDLSSPLGASVSGLEANSYVDVIVALENNRAIVFCPETYDVARDVSSLADVPPLLVQGVTEQARLSLWDAACKAWLQNHISSSIDIAPMPAGLAYDV